MNADFERGYARGRRDAEAEFQKLMSRAILWARPNGRPKRDKTAAQQERHRKKRGPNTKLQGRRKFAPRICEVCGAQFKYPSALKKHMRSHEGRTCPDCGEKFKNVQGLGAHTRYGHCNGASPPP